MGSGKVGEDQSSLETSVLMEPGTPSHLPAPPGLGKDQWEV